MVNINLTSGQFFLLIISLLALLYFINLLVSALLEKLLDMIREHNINKRREKELKLKLNPQKKDNK